MALGIVTVKQYSLMFYKLVFYARLRFKPKNHNFLYWKETTYICPSKLHEICDVGSPLNEQYEKNGEVEGLTL